MQKIDEESNACTTFKSEVDEMKPRFAEVNWNLNQNSGAIQNLAKETKEVRIFTAVASRNIRIKGPILRSNNTTKKPDPPCRQHGAKYSRK